MGPVCLAEGRGVLRIPTKAIQIKGSGFPLRRERRGWGFAPILTYPSRGKEDIQDVPTAVYYGNRPFHPHVRPGQGHGDSRRSGNPEPGPMVPGWRFTSPLRESQSLSPISTDTWDNPGAVHMGPVCLAERGGVQRILTQAIQIKGSGFPLRRERRVVGWFSHPYLSWPREGGHSGRTSRGL